MAELRRTLILFGVAAACALAIAPSALAASSYASSVLTTPSLVSFWRLAEQGAQTDAEGMTAADATGNDPGTYHLGVSLGQPGSLDGDPETAAGFGTPDGYVTLPYAADLNTVQFSVEGWVQPTVASNYMVVVGNGAQTTTHSGFAVETETYYGNSALDVVWGDGTTNHLINGTVYTPGDWYYFAATYDGTTMRWYINGKLIGSAAAGYQASASLPMVIGENPVIAHSGQLVGNVDDVAEYSTALTAASVAAHYAAGISDGAAPITTLTAGPAALTGATSATFSFTSNAVQATYQCELDAGGWQACLSPYTVSGLTPGAHQFSVRAINRAGEVDPSPTSETWTVDTSPPETTFAAGPPPLTGSTSATFSFQAGAGARFMCQVDGKTPVPCTSPLTISDLADGTHTLAVTASDPAGNQETNPATYTWSVDTAAPSSFITAGPTGASPGSSLVFSANQGGAHLQCSVDGAAWQSCTSPLSGLPQTVGTHTVAVRAINALGEVGPSSPVYAWTVGPVAGTTTNGSGAPPTTTKSPPAAPRQLQLRVTLPRNLVIWSVENRRLRQAQQGCGKKTACIAKTRSRVVPTFAWRTAAPGTVVLALVTPGGRTLARATMWVKSRTGRAAIPNSVLRKLTKTGRYDLRIQATASGYRAASVTKAVRVSR